MEPVRRAEQLIDEPTLVSRTVSVPGELSLDSVFTQCESPRILWDPPDGPTIICGGIADAVAAVGPDRFSIIRDWSRRLFADCSPFNGPNIARPRMFGGFAFHADHTDTGIWSGFPAAQFVLPAVQVIVTAETTWVTVNLVDPNDTSADHQLTQRLDQFSDETRVNAGHSVPEIASKEYVMDESDWKDSVAEAVSRIRSGLFSKVVLAQSMQVELERTLSTLSILQQLQGDYPSCTHFVFESIDGSRIFFGATPEQLVALEGQTVTTGALAGTIGRGDSPAADKSLASTLLADSKNTHEHELVVEAICDQLTPFSEAITIGDRSVRKLATVQHLETPISAHVHSDTDILPLVESLHPTPAVGGLPPRAAFNTITEMENFTRGWYASPVGWIDAHGDGAFSVSIRSAVAAADLVQLYAGVGIVADSNPTDEWDEIQLKFRPILDQLE